MSAAYQGHLADGSSVQKHSAGGIYPYVLYAQQRGEFLRWCVLSPEGTRTAFAAYDEALHFAVVCKALDTLHPEFSA